MNWIPTHQKNGSRILFFLLVVLPFHIMKGQCTSEAGPNQTLNQGVSVFLDASTPTLGTGTWSQVSGPSTASYDNVNNENTEVFGLTAGDYVFQWTVTDGVCVPATDTVEITILGIDLELGLSASNLTPDIGDVVTFTVNLNNSGVLSATGVSIENLVPVGYGGVTAISNGGTFSFVSNVVTWTGLSIPAGTSINLTFNATVQTPTGVADEFTHIAEVAASDQFDLDSTPSNDDGDQSEDDEDNITASPLLADLSLTKSVVGNNLSPNVGEKISFQITVFNGGPDDATNVQVSDVLATGFDFDQFSTTAGLYDELTGVWDIGTVASGSNETLLIDVSVNPTGNYTNSAEVIVSDAFDMDSTPNNTIGSEDDQDEVTVTPVQIVDLSLTKTVDNVTPEVNTDVVFTLTVTNDGPNDATTVQVSDVLPSGFAYDSDDGGIAYDAVSGLWNVGTLASGGSATLNITATVNTTGLYTNTAEIIGHDQLDLDSTPNNGVLSEDDQDAITLVPNPLVDISVTKIADDMTPNVGDSIVFTISVTNDGPSNATNVEVTDFLASGYGFASALASNGGYDPLNGLWTIGNLANGATETLTLTANVLPNGDYTNTVELTGLTEDDIDSEPANNDVAEDDQQTIVPVPVLVSDLILRKSVNVLSPFVGDEVIFNISISNTGPSDVTGVEVLDLLPSGYTYVSNSRTAGVYNPTTGIWELNGVIPNGTTETLNLMATVNPTGDYFNVTEVLSSSNLDPNSTPNNNVVTENDQDSAGTTPLPSADLSLDKTVDEEFPDVGDTITFTLTVTNDGLSDATGVMVLDVLPSGFTYVSDDSGGTYSPVTGLWNIGTIFGGSTAILNLTVQVNPIGDYTNIAEVIASIERDPDSTPGNNILSEDDQDEQSVAPRMVADVSVTKTTSDLTPSVGEQVVFTITVNNAGPNDASNVVVEDVLASGFLFVSSNASVGTYNDATGGWSLNALASGATETLQITVEVLPIGIYTNTAELIASDTFDPDSSPNNNLDPEDDQDTIILVPNGLADLSLTKVVDNPTPNVGDIIEFSLHLNNEGPNDATGVMVLDILPSGYTYQSHVATAGVYNEQTGVWTLNGTVFSGNTETLSILVTVNPPSGNTDEYLNIAEILGSDFADPDSSPLSGLSQDDLSDGLADDDEATVQVVPQTIDISIAKTVDIENPQIGDDVVFTITVSNAGPQLATNIGIEEQLPSGYRLVSAQPDSGNYDEGTGFWDIDTLDAFSTTSLRITVEVLDLNDYLNTTSLAFVDQFDTNDSNNTAQASVEPSCLIVYNEFSPNGDGVNETFTIDCISRYPNNVLKVFNRWGNIVFEQRSYNNDWEGISNGRATVQKGQQLPVGTYYYVLDLGDGSEPRTDWLYINR